MNESLSPTPIVGHMKMRGSGSKTKVLQNSGYILLFYNFGLARVVSLANTFALANTKGAFALINIEGL